MNGAANKYTMLNDAARYRPPVFVYFERMKLK